jgi:hypothetical protein
MSTIVIPHSFSAGATILAAEHNENFDTIAADYNGNITNTNIAGGASIVDTKLNQITTASKVHGSSLTGLASINTATAGIIPAASCDTGTTAGKILALNSAGKIPAVDGSLLTGMSTAAPKSLVKAWGSISYSGATPTLNTNYNVSGVSGGATGVIGITWATNFSSTNYCIIGNCRDATAFTVTVTSITTSGTVLNLSDPTNPGNPDGLYVMAIE